nr:MAG TPA: hypothetical protein [Caudoviricetes sp.]
MAHVPDDRTNDTHCLQGTIRARNRRFTACRTNTARLL